MTAAERKELIDSKLLTVKEAADQLRLGKSGFSYALAAVAAMVVVSELFRYRQNHVVRRETPGDLQAAELRPGISRQ
jgi:hypothetical protein